jgi:hypothetical protein
MWRGAICFNFHSLKGAIAFDNVVGSAGIRHFKYRGASVLKRAIAFGLIIINIYNSAVILGINGNLF